MGWFSWLMSTSKSKNSDAHKNFDQRPPLETISVEDTTIAGPFCSNNLSVFLIHGTDATDIKDFLTLEEALEEKKVVVEETGQVNCLRIKNVSSDAVFIQSGDILKGGKQDRAIQYDMILDPKSGFIPVNSFCVERGRWRQRGLEDDRHFSTSHHNLSHKSLKMAAKYSNSQQEVWEEVQKMQTRTADNASVPLSQVQNESSPSSLDLTLETETIQESIKKYLDELSSVVDEKNDVVGFAFAINGKVNSIEVYACNALFKKMWPKLIKSAAIEAFSESRSENSFEQPSAEQVRECMLDVQNELVQEKAVSGKCKTVLKETKQNVFFEARDITRGDKWVHRNYNTR